MARRFSRSTDCRPKIHQGLIPGVGVPGKYPAGNPVNFRLGPGKTGYRSVPENTRQNAPDINIHYGYMLAERKTCNRTCCVWPDSRELTQERRMSGYLTSLLTSAATMPTAAPSSSFPPLPPVHFFATFFCCATQSLIRCSSTSSGSAPFSRTWS